MAPQAHREAQADLWETLPQWLAIFPNDMLMPVTSVAGGILPCLTGSNDELALLNEVWDLVVDTF